MIMLGHLLKCIQQFNYIDKLFLKREAQNYRVYAIRESQNVRLYASFYYDINLWHSKLLISFRIIRITI